MPTLLERLFGKKETPKAEQPTMKVSEEAARLRREQLEKERLAAEEARKRAEEAEKQRLAAIEAQKAAALASHEYVVKSGDSLSKIAKELYGDAKRWPEIYEANKALIGDNPNMIHPGQKLIIR